jgi:hypothetical protein
MTTPFSEFGPFAVGEICRIQGLLNRAECNGEMVEILSGEHEDNDAHNPNIFYSDWYAVKSKSGARWLVRRGNMRRVKPPAADSNERTHMQRWRDMADKAPQRVEVPA